MVLIFNLLEIWIIQLWKTEKHLLHKKFLFVQKIEWEYLILNYDKFTKSLSNIRQDHSKMTKHGVVHRH